MVLKTIWATSADGTIDYLPLTAEYLNDALKVLRKSFYRYESVAVAVGLAEEAEAMDEMDNFVKDVSKDGVSIIAVERKTNVVCGVSFNKLQVLSADDDGTYYKNYAASCKTRPTRDLIHFMDDADQRNNLFEILGVDCILETMFISTLPEFMGRGIGLKLCEVSMEVAKALKLKKENVKRSLDGTQLPLEPVPQAVSALFTSPTSQKIGKKLNWTIIDKVGFDTCFTNGKPFSSVLGDRAKYSTVECIKI